MEGRPRLRYRKDTSGGSFCAVANSSDVGILLMQKTGAHVRSWPKFEVASPLKCLLIVINWK
jgi:hypothetical protein